MLKPTPQKRELLAHTLRRDALRVFAVVAILVFGALVASVMRPVNTFAVTTPADTINFQARLENSDGSVAPDGLYSVEFKLYNASSGGTALWTETHTVSGGNGLRVQNGYLTVSLGDATTGNPFANAAPAIDWSQQLYLTMNVGGTDPTTPSWDGEMSPRLALTAVPYAFSAQNLKYNDGTNTNSLTWDTQTGNNSILLPGASGTVCLQSSSGCGFATGSGQAILQGGNTFGVTETIGTKDAQWLQLVTNNSARLSINSSGQVGIGLNPGNARVGIAGLNTQPALILQNGSSQTADILQIVASDGSTILSKFDQNGNLSVGTAQDFGAITIANSAWITGVDSSGTGVVDMFSVNGNNEIQVGAALNVDGGIVLPTDGGQITFSDLPVDGADALGTPESYTLSVGSANALTIYGESDGSSGVQNVRVAVGSNINPQYTLDVSGDINAAGVYRIGGVQVCSSSGCSASSVSAILNQTTQQTAANFNIDGTGSASILQAGTFDTAAAGALNIGTTNATGGINLNQNTVVKSGKTLTVGNSVFDTNGDLTVSGTGSQTAITATTGTGTAVSGSASGAGTGVYGSSSSGTGVYGSSSTGSGVSGISLTGNAVNGTTALGTAGDFQTSTGYASAAPTVYIGGGDVQTGDLLQLSHANISRVITKFDFNGQLTSYGTNTRLLALATPAFGTNTSTTTGGTLTTPNTYYYVITATNAQGETVASTSTSFVPTTTTSTYTLNWSAVTGASGYKVYRNTSNSFTGGSLLLTTITSGNTLTYTDIGTATTAGLPPQTPTGTGLTLQGWSGQTADLLQAQNSAGTSLAGITSTGTVYANRLTFSGGTQGAPGLYVTGDSNTGLYSAGSDILDVTAGGTQVAMFSSTAISLAQDTTIISGKTLTANGTVLVQPNTNSTTAFQVKRSTGSTGTPVLTVDTSNSQVTIQGTNTSATLGAELANNNFTTSSWTAYSSGWTMGSTSASYNTGAGFSNPLAFQRTGGAGGSVYQLVFTISGYAGGSLLPTVGGSYTYSVNANGTYTQVVDARSGSTSPQAIQFYPSADFVGNVSAVSLKQYTVSNAQMVLNNSSGANSLEVRASNGNIAFGTSAGQYLSSGAGGNIALGFQALNVATTGSSNIALGFGSLASLTTGSSNVAIGEQAGESNATGSGNVFLGYQAGYNELGSNKLYIANSSTSTPLIYGDFGTGAGDGALTVNGSLTVTSASNFNGTVTVAADKTLTAKGTVLLQNNTNSTTALQVKRSIGSTGTPVLTVDTTNAQTIFQAATDTATLGSEMMTASESFPAATGWTSISGTGQTATATHTSGGGTTSISPTPSLAISAGKQYQIKFTLTNGGTPQGSFQIKLGGASSGSILNNNPTVSYTTSLVASDITNLTFIPTNDFDGTLSSVSVKLITQFNPALVLNNANGSAAIEVRTGGSTNQDTYIGTGSGEYSLNGLSYNNTALGYQAMQNMSTGGENTALGAQAMQNSTSAYYNTAVGEFALQGLIDGTDNIALGGYTLGTNNGNDNTALGFSAGYSNASGSSNVFVGSLAGYNNTGSGNVFLGYHAGYNETGSNKLYIANSNTSSPLIYGDFSSSQVGINGSLGVGTQAPGAKLDVQSATSTGTGLNVTANSLTTGTAVNVSSAASNRTTGNLVNINEADTYTLNSSTAASTLNITRNLTTNVASAEGTVAFDSSASGIDSTSSTTMTWSHTVGGGSNRLLLVGVSVYNNAVSSVTYAGQAMTQVDAVFPGGTVGNTYIFKLVNPPSGTANVVVTLAGATAAVGSSASYSNVNQSTPIAAFAHNSGTSGTASVSVASTVAEKVFDIASLNVNTTATAGGGQTVIENQGLGGLTSSSSYKAAGAGTTTMSWTYGVSTNTWGQVAVAVKGTSSGSVLNVSGSLAGLTSNCTLVSGGCTDSSSILSLNQQFSGASGAVMKIQNSGTGDMMDLLNSSGSVVTKFNSNGDLQIGTTSSNNSATALLVQNSSGQALLTADTSAMKVTITSLVISTALTINGHIVTGGNAPTIAAGAAACTSPTVSISGNDTAGVITVTTGTSCASTGKLAGVTFNAAFGAAPRVTLTPANGSAAALQYYYDASTATTTSFDLDTSTTPVSSTIYKYSYHVEQ